MEKFKVTLTDEEREALQHLVSVGKAAARKLAHARILLLADEGPGGPRRTDEDIVEALGVSPSTIARVRKRFVTESLGAALDHRPQPPRPEKVKITDAVEEQLIRLACSDPPRGVAAGPSNSWPTSWWPSGACEASRARRSAGRSKKRHPALGREDVVPAPEGGRGLRLAHGGRPGGLPVALRPGSSGGLPGRGEQATDRRGGHPGARRPGRPPASITSTSGRGRATCS